MQRRHFIKLACSSTVLGSLNYILGCTPKSDPSGKRIEVAATVLDEHEYWTCSMHPQIHKNEPGRCPICGMPLIKVKKNKGNDVSSDSKEFEPSKRQLKNSQISRYTVNREKLIMSLPVSGRLISDNTVVFQVYESDLEMINKGADFSGTLVNDTAQVFFGKIVSVDRLIDPSSRTVRVTGVLKKSVINFISDIAFHGTIEKVLDDVIVVPEEAVLHTGTRDLVYVFSSENKISVRQVRLGLKSREKYQITSGLKEGEVISAGANFLIDSESKIRGE